MSKIARLRREDIAGFIATFFEGDLHANRVLPVSNATLGVLTIALLSMLGAAGESLAYERWLKANTVKRHTHSLFRQGLMLYDHIPNWPQERLQPLLGKFAELLNEQRLFRDAFGVIGD